MPLITRWLLRRLREPVGCPFMLWATHQGPAGLVAALQCNGWQIGQTILGPASDGVRALVVIIAVFVGVGLGILSNAASQGPVVFAAMVAIAWLILTGAFTNLSCGPVVRFRKHGLEVGSASEGDHFVPWEDVRAWRWFGHFCVIDLGPGTPLASRCLFISQRPGFHRS